MDDPAFEMDALKALIDALFTTKCIDEVEPLVLRLREAAKAYSEKEGFCFAEFNSVLLSARLHEVICMHPAFGNPLSRLCYCFKHGRIASVCHKLHRAREKAHAPVEPCALCRHAASLKRPRGRCALCSTGCARKRQQCRSGPRHVENCCGKRASTSRFSIGRMGRRSSTRRWQPKGRNCVRSCAPCEIGVVVIYAAPMGEIPRVSAFKYCIQGYLAHKNPPPPAGPYSSPMPRDLW